MVPDDRTLQKGSDCVLHVSLSPYNTLHYFYDFSAKVMVTSTSNSEGGYAVTPFSQLDQEMLKTYRDALIELGGHPPELQTALPVQSQSSTESWVRMGSSSIAHVGTYPEIRQKLTTVFNLASRERFVITDDLKTGVKAVTTPISFDNYSPAVIGQALSLFKSAGGECDEEFVMTGKANLKKNAL